MLTHIKRYIVPLFIALSFSTHACLLHPALNAQGTSTPKGAVWVDIQTQLAMQNGALEPAQLQTGEAGFRQVSWWLRLFTRMLSESGVTHSYIYIADIGLWAKHNVNGNVQLELEVEPEQESSNVIILSRQTLQAIISQNLTYQQGVELGIVISS
ncbi:hypothetical protein BIZ37_10490 [Photobacterium sp. BZF1]|uniref:hypothetical protein n=1 Tax=Photobacterium sp. BZF1 TaxID=1904457 RepID=UPI001653B7EB|nr:hypothetical protein [Photobacterium sp. BZF1]MBC7002986.1 hypothetical protein [Photobacterium sp. BZF1]